jgi:hypothetical protein
MTKPTHQVITDYSSPYTEPVLYKEGEPVEVLEKETEWPGWIWCVNSRGDKRWIPDVYLRVEGKKAWLLQDYNSRELAAQRDDVVTVFYQVNDWGWCRDSAGLEGWLPLDHLTAL